MSQKHAAPAVAEGEAQAASRVLSPCKHWPRLTRLARGRATGRGLGTATGDGAHCGRRRAVGAGGPVPFCRACSVLCRYFVVCTNLTLRTFVEIPPLSPPSPPTHDFPPAITYLFEYNSAFHSLAFVTDQRDLAAHACPSTLLYIARTSYLTLHDSRMTVSLPVRASALSPPSAPRTVRSHLARDALAR